MVILTWSKKRSTRIITAAALGAIAGILVVNPPKIRKK